MTKKGDEVSLGGDGATIAKEVLEQIEDGVAQPMVVSTKLTQNGAAKAPEYLLKNWNEVGKTLFDAALSGKI